VVYGKKGNGPHGAHPVRTLVSQELVSGAHSVQWDGRDDQGTSLSPGIYRVVLAVGDESVCGDIQIE
jgi:flagellar hook assembly protein FlgD